MFNRKLRLRLKLMTESRDFYRFMVCKNMAEDLGDYEEAERLYQMWSTEGRVDGLRSRT